MFGFEMTPASVLTVPSHAWQAQAFGKPPPVLSQVLSRSTEQKMVSLGQKSSNVTLCIGVASAVGYKNKDEDRHLTELLGMCLICLPHVVHGSSRHILWTSGFPLQLYS